MQILQVTKHMSHFAKFRTAAICGGANMKPQREKLATPLDLVVGTPGRILQHVDQVQYAQEEVASNYYKNLAQ